MDNKEITPQIDPNEADIDTLCTIPGVGHALATRIIEARPFTSLEDMTRVSGITSNFIEKNRPNLIFKVPEDPVAEVVEQPDEISPEDDASDSMEQVEPPIAPMSEGKEIILVSKGEEEKSDELPPPREVEKNGKEKTPPYVTRSQAMWMAFNSGLFAFVLAVALSLGLIASLNGGLRFASVNQAGEMAVELGGLKTTAESLAVDVTSLRTRMDNLEVFSGRVTTMEENFANLQSDLDAVAEGVTGFNAQVEALSGEIAGLQEDNDKYQSFLDGLFELLKTITTPEEVQ